MITIATYIDEKYGEIIHKLDTNQKSHFYSSNDESEFEKNVSNYLEKKYFSLESDIYG